MGFPPTSPLFCTPEELASGCTNPPVDTGSISSFLHNLSDIGLQWYQTINPSPGAGTVVGSGVPGAGQTSSPIKGRSPASGFVVAVIVAGALYFLLRR